MTRRIVFASLFSLGVFSPMAASANCYGTGGVSQTIGVGTSYGVVAAPVYDVATDLDVLGDVGCGVGADIVQQLPVVTQTVVPTYLQQQVVVQSVPVIQRQVVVQRSFVGSGFSTIGAGYGFQNVGYGVGVGRVGVSRLGGVGYGVGLGGINQNIGLGTGLGVGGLNQSIGLGTGLGVGRGRAVNVLKFRRNGTLRKARQRVR